MKHLFLSLILIVTTQLNAQVDQFTALKNIKEKTEFTGYWGIRKEEGGYTGTAYEDSRVLSYKQNEINQIASFYINYDYVEKKEADPAQPRPDHETKPALFYSSFTGVGMVIMDSLIYQFKRNKKENILAGNFTIEFIFEIKSPAVTKKKGGFSKALKSQLKGGSGKGLCRSKKIAETDHVEVLKKYFIEMKKIQEVATKNFTVEQKEEFALLKAIQNGDEEARMQVVSADFEKSKQASPTKVAIKNNRGSAVCIVVDDMGYSLASGEQMSFSCDKDVYFGATNGASCTSEIGDLLVGKKSACNKVITID